MAECVLSLIVAETVQRSTNQEKQGYETGYRIVEQMSERRLGTDPLEVMKFLCKELWFGMFGKQVDKLQTVWKSTSELGHPRHRAQTQQRKHVDGVGRPKFDFHAGSKEH